MESGPLALRNSINLAEISLSAWSQLMRWYLPSTNFMGWRKRNSPWPCSRNAAPLAQWAPKLMGESNTGSWRTQTPFSTTASTAQPTEQWVHTVRLTSILPDPSPLLGPAAWDFFTKVSWLAAKPTPTPKPERRKKARRSMVGMAWAKPRCKRCTKGEPARTVLSDFLVNSMGCPWSDAGGLVITLDVFAQAVAAALGRCWRQAFSARQGRRVQRFDARDGGHGCTGRSRSPKKPTAGGGWLVVVHSILQKEMRRFTPLDGWDMSTLQVLLFSGLLQSHS